MPEQQPLSPQEIMRIRCSLDRQEIWQCLLRYARGVDRLDEELIRSAFWTDAHIAQGATSGSVDDFIAGWLPTQEGRETGMHLVSNQTVDFDDEERMSAHAETYYLAAVKSTSSDEMDILGGRLIERYEKRSGEWRISERLALRDWQMTGDASRMRESLAQRHQGSRTAHDPSYERPLHPRQAIPGPS